MNRQYGALSGIAVILIVLNHAVHFGLQVAPVERPALNGLIFLQALGAFAVPAFLFVSGAFLSYSANQLSLQFVRGSLARLLWPYLIWSVAFYALMPILEGAGPSAAGAVKNLLVGYPYHFVPLLVFWYLAAPFIVKLEKHGLWLLGAIGAYQWLLLAVRYPQVFGGEWLAEGPASNLLRVPVLFTSMSDWAIYFPMGLIVSRHHASLKPYLVRFRLVLVALTVGLFAAGILTAFGMASLPWARFVVPVPLMLLLPLVSRDSIPSVRRLETLGKQSYGVYLSHFPFINLLALLASALLASSASPIRFLVYPAFFVLALAFPLVLMDLMTRTAPTQRIYRYLFGVAPQLNRGQRRPAGDVLLAAKG